MFRLFLESFFWESDNKDPGTASLRASFPSSPGSSITEVQKNSLPIVTGLQLDTDCTPLLPHLPKIHAEERQEMVLAEHVDEAHKRRVAVHVEEEDCGEVRHPLHHTNKDKDHATTC